MQVGNRSKRKTYQFSSEKVELIINLDKLLNEVSQCIIGKSQSKEEIVWKLTQLTHCLSLFDRYV